MVIAPAKTRKAKYKNNSSRSINTKKYIVKLNDSDVVTHNVILNDFWSNDDTLWKKNW